MPKQDDNEFCERGIGSIQTRAKTKSEGIVVFLSSVSIPTVVAFVAIYIARVFEAVKIGFPISWVQITFTDFFSYAAVCFGCSISLRFLRAFHGVSAGRVPRRRFSQSCQMGLLSSGHNCTDGVFCFGSHCGFVASLFDAAESGIAPSLRCCFWPFGCFRFIRFLVIEKDCGWLVERPWQCMS